MGSLPKQIEVMEVCPRDGWQNHKTIIPTETKIKYIKAMIDCGARSMDVTSFVSPKAVPQMADAAEVVNGVMDYAREKGCRLSGLALNKKGVENARAAGLTDVSFVLSVSEEHNLRNARRTVEESLTMLLELAEEARDLHISLALPCVFGSPFGDEIPMTRVKRIIQAAQKAGIREIGVADTASISNPAHTKIVLRAIGEYTDIKGLSLHMHDSYGMGMANVYAALEEGVTKLDASLGGMGGCPFVPGAKGNIATEDLIYMLDSIGIESGYDLEKLNQTAAEMAKEVRVELTSCQSHHQ